MCAVSASQSPFVHRLSSIGLNESSCQDIRHSDVTHCYCAYGLIIDSEIDLPHLKASQGLPADITIRYGDVPQSLEVVTHAGSAWQIAPGQLLLKIEGVAEYWVNGTEVWICPAPGAKDHDIRIFLLGSVLGFILHQHRILALHASAIRTEHGAVLFTGNSGAGKSTTLAAMVKRGYAMLADDVSGIFLDQAGRPQVLPAFPASRLWADAAEKLNQSTQGIPRVRTDYDKYQVSVSHFCPTPVPLLGVYVLTAEQRSDIALKPVESTVQKFSLLAMNTYREVFIAGTGWEKEHFQMISQILEFVYVTQVIRPSQFFMLDELVTSVERDIASHPPTESSWL